MSTGYAKNRGLLDQLLGEAMESHQVEGFRILVRLCHNPVLTRPTTVRLLVSLVYPLPRGGGQFRWLVERFCPDENRSCSPRTVG